MGDKTSIEWTDSTWNPIRGCSRVSEGCRNCYAERVAARFSGAGQAYERLAVMTPSGPRWTGEVKLIEEHLEDPLRWTKPRRIFVNSMSDLFHPKVKDEWIDKIFMVMGDCDEEREHIFQVLTKRPERMLSYMKTRARAAWNAPRMNRGAFPPHNVWLGVSVEDQKTADERIPLLLQTPAAVRFLSCEPLLGMIDLTRWINCYVPDVAKRKGERRYIGSARRCDLHWVIAGGESGPGARPMHPDWPRSLRDQCVAAGVPFFFKQWGEWCPLTQIPKEIDIDLSFPANDKRHCKQLGSAVDSKCLSIKTGKNLAGRLLDGEEWNQFPEVK